MGLEDLLVKKKDAVLKKWFELIAQTSPDGGTSMVKTKDRFTNPVGHITSSAIESLYEELIRGKSSSEKIVASLEEIIRIRAVQDFTPSRAIVFVFLLKKAVRDVVGGDKNFKGLYEDMLRYESLIDEVAFQAFDIYMNYREKIFQVKINEMKSREDRMVRLVERISGTGADV